MLFLVSRVEYEEKLSEIIKKTNIITIRGKKFESSIDDLENMGELGWDQLTEFRWTFSWFFFLVYLRRSCTFFYI